MEQREETTIRWPEASIVRAAAPILCSLSCWCLPCLCRTQVLNPIRTVFALDFLPDNWEGGIRMNSFISGGFIPVKQRGTVYRGLVAAWDW